MLSKNKEKYLRSLHRKKQRQIQQMFLAEGEKIAQMALTCRPDLIESVWATTEWLEKYRSFFLNLDIPKEELSMEELKRISSLQTPNQVILTCRMPAASRQLGFQRIAIFLDGLQDPGNLGTIFRLADWFGVDCVYLGPDCVDPYNAKVIQASMGAIFTTTFQHAMLGDVKAENPSCTVVGAVMDGSDVRTVRPDGPILLLIGSEGKGVHPVNKALIDQSITILPASSSKMESLNAAMACGIILSQFTLEL